MPAIESRTEGLWWGRQTAKGTPALATATTNKRGRKVGGDVNVNRDDGSENYSDGQRFGDAADFVNTIVGEGAPVVQASPDVAGHLAHLMLGSEVVTGAADPYEHVATPGTTAFWFTVWKLVGASVGPLKQKFSDCRMTSLRIEGSSANKVVKLTPTFTSLDAGEVFTTDPVAASGTENPLLYTEGEGRFTIDGAVFKGHSSFAIVINDPTPPWYGDAVTPEDITSGIASVVLEGITILVNAQGLQRYNQAIYGTATPAAGAKPVKAIPALGSYAVDLQRGRKGTLTTTGTPTGGTVTLTVDGIATTFAYNATAAAIQSALEANLGTGNAIATGGPLPTGVVITLPRHAVVTTTHALTGGTAPTSVWTDSGILRQLKIEVPGVKWSPDLAIAGNPDGGPVELALAGEARKSGSSPHVRITTRSGDAAYV